jgi:hypothetical protein
MDFMKKILDTLHHLFIPRHTNNFTARLLHHDLLTVYLIIALSVTLGVKHLEKTGDVLGYATDVSVQKLFDQTNKEREKMSLQPLQYNEKLAEAAKDKAENMFNKNYWSHYGPTGETPWEFILGSGYQYEYAGENLAKNFLFSDGVVEAWMNSETHKENILRSEYTDVGFAVVNGVLNGEETTLVVQMFGKPLYAAETPVTPPQTNEIPQAQKVAAQKPATVTTEPQVLARDVSKQTSTFFPAYFNLNILFLSVLLLALLFDFYFAAKLNLIRVKGKNLVHFMFIGFIMIGAFIIIRGGII